MKHTTRVSGRFHPALLMAGLCLALGMAAAPSQAKEASGTANVAYASRAFRDAAAKAQTSLAGNDLAGAGGIISALVPTSPLEIYLAASLRMELAARRGDVSAQRKALADMLASGAVPPREEGRLRYLAGYAALQAGASQEGISQLTRARALGEDGPAQSLLLADAHLRKSRAAEALPLVEHAIAKQAASGKPVPLSWYDRAASLAYAQKDWSALARFHTAKLSQSTVAADWRSATAAYIAGAQPEREAELDLLRLQGAAGALASERDVQGYAALAAGQGYAAEAKAVIEAGQKSGELAATDPVSKGLLVSLAPKAVRNLADLKPLPGKAAIAATGKAASESGDKLLANAQYAEAVQYYRAAIGKGGVDLDRVNTRLGIALARSGDGAGAQAAFAQVKGKWGDVARYWSAWATKRQ